MNELIPTSQMWVFSAYCTDSKLNIFDFGLLVEQNKDVLESTWTFL